MRRQGNRTTTGRGRTAATVAAGLAAATLSFVALSTTPAAADLRVCNRTTYLLNVAIGSPSGDGFKSEGWWSIAADGCQSVVRGALQSRFLYLYAADIDGRAMVAGSVEMCVMRKSFQIDGIGDCWRRGYEAATFSEIDTLDYESWTIFLEEDGKVRGAR